MSIARPGACGRPGLWLQTAVCGVGICIYGHPWAWAWVLGGVYMWCMYCLDLPAAVPGLWQMSPIWHLALAFGIYLDRAEEKKKKRRISGR
jgi:hypothetical protein